MLIINKPKNSEEVQCFKCKNILIAHPMSNMNSDYFTNCDLHKESCVHESDGLEYGYYRNESRCTKCKEFY